ncbi:MAG: hypothetical protein SWL02_08920 [Pseudomonadota bacterium]|nr:hypothetical protein [Pseudomonadota bacterium]|tara:strand:+ start:421 stop:1809 length:1389 start_codon:yes stop_codon:yes gene_type:complete
MTRKTITFIFLSFVSTSLIADSRDEAIEIQRIFSKNTGWVKESCTATSDSGGVNPCFMAQPNLYNNAINVEIIKKLDRIEISFKNKSKPENSYQMVYNNDLDELIYFMINGLLKIEPVNYKFFGSVSHPQKLIRSLNGKIKGTSTYVDVNLSGQPIQFSSASEALKSDKQLLQAYYEELSEKWANWPQDPTPSEEIAFYNNFEVLSFDQKSRLPSVITMVSNQIQSKYRLNTSYRFINEGFDSSNPQNSIGNKLELFPSNGIYTDSNAVSCLRWLPNTWTANNSCSSEINIHYCSNDDEDNIWSCKKTYLSDDGKLAIRENGGATTIKERSSQEIFPTIKPKGGRVWIAACFAPAFPADTKFHEGKNKFKCFDMTGNSEIIAKSHLMNNKVSGDSQSASDLKTENNPTCSGASRNPSSTANMKIYLSGVAANCQELCTKPKRSYIKLDTWNNKKKLMKCDQY